MFPKDYRAYGKSEWTVTLNKNTPNATITIKAVNELIQVKRIWKVSVLSKGSSKPKVNYMIIFVNVKIPLSSSITTTYI